MLVDNSASFSALTLLLFSSLWTFSLDCSGIIALWDWYFITLIQRRRRIITIIDLDEKRMISANTRLYRINMLFTTTLNKLKKGGLLRRILYSDWQLYIIMCYARVLPFFDPCYSFISSFFIWSAQFFKSYCFLLWSSASSLYINNLIIQAFFIVWYALNYF